MRNPYRLRLIDRLYRWAAWRHYPRSDGNVILLGPECFADSDHSVICWQGENFYLPQSTPKHPNAPSPEEAARRRRERESWHRRSQA